MSRTTFFSVCAALVLALCVWITHTRRVAAEAAARAAKVQVSASADASASPAVPVSTNDVDAQPAEGAQTTEDADIPAPAETATSAITGTLYQCVDNAGETTVWKSPCPADLKTVKVMPYSVQPNSQTEVVLDRAHDAANMPQYAQPQPQQEIPVETPAMHCNDAKQSAQNERQRLGLNATFDQLRSLDDSVYEACKTH
jgi:hypothetical protein